MITEIEQIEQLIFKYGIWGASLLILVMIIFITIIFVIKKSIEKNIDLASDKALSKYNAELKKGIQKELSVFDRRLEAAIGPDQLKNSLQYDILSRAIRVKIKIWQELYSVYMDTTGYQAFYEKKKYDVLYKRVASIKKDLQLNSFYIGDSLLNKYLDFLQELQNNISYWEGMQMDLDQEHKKYCAQQYTKTMNPLKDLSKEIPIVIRNILKTDSDIQSLDNLTKDKLNKLENLKFDRFDDIQENI